MEYRRLGRTGLKVSALCMGCMTFGRNQFGVGELDEKGAREIVDACFDVGVDFFDTADMYSNGESEELLGRVLKGRRDRAVVASKCFFGAGKWPNDAGLSRGHVMDAAERSLKRLGTDYIDLYQVHCWHASTPIEETLSALDDLVRAGKVRYLGCSNFAAWQLAKSLGVSERRGLARFDSIQPYYSLVCRDVEDEIVPLCQAEGVGILPWSPLAGGWLSGKYRRGQPRPPESRYTDSTSAFLKPDEQLVYRTVEILDEIVGVHDGATVSQAALNWLLTRPAISSVIIGCRTLKQLQDNLGAVKWKMTAAEADRLAAVTAAAPRYPRWFTDMFAGV
ncbi:MAG: aldo/keto reductase [Candidatus Wallbacteria bacterium]|nr:aldo/keto reductase [Candidatus Wallbacteria bacterium]